MSTITKRIAIASDCSDEANTTIRQLGMPRPGELFEGRYRVERVLAFGGMAVIVEARHRSLGHRVAIKLPGPWLDSQPRAHEQILFEAQSLVRLRSPHSLHVYDFGKRCDGTPFMVMELLDGSDLRQTLRDDGPLQWRRATRLVAQAARGLAEAHALGIVHRDVKPANLFVCRQADSSELVKVLDFGIGSATTRAEQAGGQSVRGDQVLGSPAYMSPEQLATPSVTDCRSDLWSLGVTLFELLTGDKPFSGNTQLERLASVIYDQPPSLCETRPGLDFPVELQRVLSACLEKDPTRRIQTMTELSDALDRMLAMPTQPATTTHIVSPWSGQPGQQPLLPKCSPRWASRLVTCCFALAFLLLGGVLAVLLVPRAELLAEPAWSRLIAPRLPAPDDANENQAAQLPAKSLPTTRKKPK